MSGCIRADYWSVSGMEDPMDCTDPDEAVEEWLRDTDSSEWPESLTVMAYVIDGPWDGESYPLRRAPHLDRRVSCDAPRLPKHYEWGSDNSIGHTYSNVYWMAASDRGGVYAYGTNETPMWVVEAFVKSGRVKPITPETT